MPIIRSNWRSARLGTVVALIVHVAHTRANRNRIGVRVPPGVSSRHERELGAFARYCVLRIEKDLGEREQWNIELDIRSPGYSARVEVQHLGLELVTKGQGHDGPLAIWDAMCLIEQELRDRRGAVFATLRDTRAAND